MQLNETTARIDAQLDGVCKKIEKIELDTRGDQEGGNLTYKVNYAGPGSKCQSLTYKLSYQYIVSKSNLSIILFDSSLRLVYPRIQVGKPEISNQTLS